MSEHELMKWILVIPHNVVISFSEQIRSIEQSYFLTPALPHTHEASKRKLDGEFGDLRMAADTSWQRSVSREK